ncbi:hypothetical protein D3C78_1615340 [compost metagenome]
MVCALQPAEGRKSRSSRLRLKRGMVPWWALARSSLASPVRDTGGVYRRPSPLANTPRYSPRLRVRTDSGAPKVKLRTPLRGGCWGCVCSVMGALLE